MTYDDVTAPSDDETATDYWDGAPALMTCVLAAEALADAHDTATRTGTGIMHFDGRINKVQMATFVRKLAAHDRSIRAHQARRLISVPRWPAPLDRRARPAGGGGLLLLNLEIRGDDPGGPWPGAHQECIIDLDLLREAVTDYAYSGGRDGEIGEDEVYALTWSCLAVLSHPRGWYPPPFVTARDNMLAVCRKAADALLAEIRGGSNGPPDAAWTVTEWLRDGAVPARAGTLGRPLYEAYAAWCRAREDEPASETAWGRALTDAGYPSEKRHDGRYRALRPRAAG